MTKVEFAVQWCLNIANDSSHGYSQYNRWGPDYDCSSMIISAYEAAGIPVKTAGAQRTYDMEANFKKCGFEIVKNWNKATGAGLIRGDVVLNVNHHVEMYIGNGQLVKASQDEYGGIAGVNKGDQTGQEIRVSGYYNFPWDMALRYRNQTEQYTGVSTSFPNASEYALTGTLVDVEPDYKEIKSYMITLDRGANNVNYEALKGIGVVGVMLDVGHLYDGSHMELDTFKSPTIDTQVNAVKKADLPYALYTIVRSRSIAEANKELKWLRIYIQKYTPELGVWLKLELASNKSMNDMIISRYKTLLTASGLKGKMGFYVTRRQLSAITWSKWQDDFLLWLVDPVKDISDIETILDPTFFDL